MKRFLAIVFCGMLALTSCSKPVERTKRELCINIPSDPQTLDPRKGGDMISSMMHFLLFEGFARMNEEGQFINTLAERIDLSENRKVYTFYITDSYWSDGSPITAWDFEKSWKDILHPDFPAMNAHLLYPIKNAEGAKKGLTSLSEVGIKSLDAKTLEVTLERPTPYFLELAAFCVFFPVNSEVDHSRPDWDQMCGSNFVCSGPFRLKEWKRNNVIILEKNPYYVNADQTLLDEIRINMVDSESTSLHMFEKGQIDVLGQPGMKIPNDAIQEIRKRGCLYTQPAAATTFCSFNVQKFPFNNANIRKAFSYAINRRDIVRNITQLDEKPALGAIPPVLKKGQITAFYTDGDTETAKMLFEIGLEELGIKKEEFPNVTYIYTATENDHKIAQALQQQWKETLDITVQLERVDKKILLHHLTSGTYNFAQTFWMAQYFDQMNILERFKDKRNAKNYPNWENDEFVALLNHSHDALTPEERATILLRAEKIFLDEMPIAPIYHWNSAYIVQPHVLNMRYRPNGVAYFHLVDIDQDLKKSPIH